MAIIGAKEEHADPRLTRITQADTVGWYRKPNLRFLYMILVPTALGVEWTSGFDSSMMNSLQAVQSWQECMISYPPTPSCFSPPGLPERMAGPLTPPRLRVPYSGRLGLLNAMYSLGALMSIPFIPSVSQYLGRCRAIFAATLVICIGAGL